MTRRQTVARGALARALKAAGLDGDDKPTLRFHDLRHTFASLLMAQGCNVVFLSRQLGHASPDITLKVYAHLFDAAEHAERAAAALEQGFGAVLDGNGVESDPRDEGRTGEEPAGSNVAYLRRGATGSER